MALRTFHAYPSIGGFASESTPAEDGDALCQIVKELVDNAVDACCQSSSSSNEQQQVKVEINEHDQNTLQVTVSDNGVGMVDIQECVKAFKSTKGDDETAGRYGIGLTLSMLHAQRLVPNSYACIKSATKNCSSFTKEQYFVDTDGDNMECRKHELLPKTFQEESGTCVIVFVPGGTLAELAWVRLENYFSRFRLIPGLRCSLEVFAPTLSNVPIFVQAQTNTVVSLHSSSSSSSSSSLSNISQGEECPWEEGRLEDAEQQHEEEQNPLQTIARQQQNRNTPERKAIFLAAQSFLKRPIKFKNVAHSVQPIRDRNNPPVDETTPKLEVAIIVSPQNEADSNDIQPADGTVAKLQLIRIVNQIPLLDNAEGSACGLVQKICNTGLWGSFGLQVEKSSESNIPCCTPQFDVRDSEQVAPFFQSQNHRLWEGRQEDSNDNEDLNDGDEEDEEAKKRKRRLPRERPLLPAKVRIGHLIVIVYIRAPPSSFSLPTLSKGRLPLNNEPIDSSLQMALRDCLRSLQATNPALLLTQAQLREAERETRYIPATALSVSRILRRMSNQTLREKWLDKISQWKNERDASPDGTRPHPELAGLIEARLKKPVVVVRLGRCIASTNWTLRFEELKMYKATHGHCNVPQRDPTNPPLGEWVLTQRKAYTKSKMNTERKEKLDSIGFVFGFVETKSAQWTLRFEELKMYKATHGNCNVPQRDPTNPPLGKWVARQRRAYTKNKMITERKEKLDSIGFVFLGIRKRKAARISNDDHDGSGSDHDQDDTSNDQDEHDVTTAARISNDDHDGGGGDHDQDDTSNDQDEHDMDEDDMDDTAARISNDDDDGSGGDHDQDDTSNDQDEHDMDEDDMDDTAARISNDDDDGSGGDHDQDDTSNDQDEHDNSSCREASPETVIRRIEEFIIHSVLEPLERGDTPQVDEPKRSFSHSMHCRSLTSLFMVADFCHELLKSGRTTTIREVYYFYVTFFRNQQECDNAIMDLASCLSVSRSALGLVASPKGWFCGCIDLYCQRDNSDNNGEMEGGQELVPILNGRELDSHGMAITLQLKTQIVRSPDAKCILVIEKEGIYHRLSEDKFFLKYYPCILVTGKGVPDLATKSWVQHLQQSLKLPVYGLCDCNPYGISVLQTFQYQGLARSHRAGTNNNNNNTRNRRQFDLKWMGLRPSQVEKLDLPAMVYQELTDHDKKRLDSLKAGTNPFCQMGNAERRIQELDKFEFKVELEALYWKGMGFLSQWVHSNLMLHEKEVQEQQPSNPESHSQYII